MTHKNCGVCAPACVCVCATVRQNLARLSLATVPSGLLLQCSLLKSGRGNELPVRSPSRLVPPRLSPSDLPAAAAGLRPQRRRQESRPLHILGSAPETNSVCASALACACVCAPVRACPCVCCAHMCGRQRSVKEFIVCSPPVIILVPINLLASLEPVAIWKHCSVYKLGKDQLSGALTSHTNLETIRARQSG